jgi:hypothetical protein
MVSPDGLVARKDTFVDAVQMQAAMGMATQMTAIVADSGTPADQLPHFDRLPAEHLFDMYVELQPARNSSPRRLAPG